MWRCMTNGAPPRRVFSADLLLLPRTLRQSPITCESHSCGNARYPQRKCDLIGTIHSPRQSPVRLGRQPCSPFVLISIELPVQGISNKKCGKADPVKSANSGRSACQPPYHSEQRCDRRAEAQPKCCRRLLSQANREIASLRSAFGCGWPG